MKEFYKWYTEKVKAIHYISNEDYELIQEKFEKA